MATVVSQEQLLFCETMAASASRKTSSSTATVFGEWTTTNSGGNRNEPTWRNNVQYFLSVKKECRVIVTLRLLETTAERASQPSIGFYVYRHPKQVAAIPNDPRGKRVMRIERKNVVSVTSFSQVEEVSSEIILSPLRLPYVIIPCTEHPGFLGNYIMEVQAEEISFDEEDEDSDQDNSTADSENPSLIELWAEKDADRYYEATVASEWTDENSGGCRRYRTWRQNPQLHMRLRQRSKIFVVLSQPEVSEGDGRVDLACIGFYLCRTSEPERRKLALRPKDVIIKSQFANVRETLVELELDPLSNGCPFIIIPATYEPGELGPFRVTVYSSEPVELSLIRDATEEDRNRFGWHMQTFRGEWSQRAGTCGGCLTSTSWRRNPQFLIRISERTKVVPILAQKPLHDTAPAADTPVVTSYGSDAEYLPGIGYYILKLPTKGANRKLLQFDGHERVGSSEFHPAWEASGKFILDDPTQDYVIIPSMANAADQAAFELTVYSDRELAIISLDEALDPSTAARAMQEGRSVPWGGWNVVMRRGAWTADTAGGCVHFSTWRRNDQYLLYPEKAGRVLILVSLEDVRGSSGATPLNASVGALLTKGDSRRPTAKILSIDRKRGPIAMSQFSLNGEAMLEVWLEPLSNGVPYVVIPSTYRPGKICNYTITAFSESSFSLVPAQAFLDGTEEGLDVKSTSPSSSGWYRQFVKGKWQGVTAGGCRHHVTWRNNPQYHLRVFGRTRVVLQLSQPPSGNNSSPFFPKASSFDGADNLLQIGFYVVKTAQMYRRKLALRASDIIAKTRFSENLEVTADIELDPLEDDFPFIVIPATFEPGENGPYTLTAYSDRPIELSLISSETEEDRAKYSWRQQTVEGTWRDGRGGSIDKDSFFFNPIYRLLPRRCVTSVITLYQHAHEKSYLAPIGFYILSVRPGVLDKLREYHAAVAGASDAKTAVEQTISPNVDFQDFQVLGGATDFTASWEASWKFDICEEHLSQDLLVIPCTQSPMAVEESRRFSLLLFSEFTPAAEVSLVPL